jgi:Alw26I/Eco31I/Esp3I family type II restriction endonuclease
MTNQEFSIYQEFIVNHKNFKSLPNKKNLNGEITWVKVKDQERTAWWDALKIEMKCPDRAAVARKIHPPELNGYKPCQICGRKMSIHPVYPNVRATKKILEAFPQLGVIHFVQDIYEITDLVNDAYGEKGLIELARIFELPETTLNQEDIANKIVEAGKLLSPGVMSNAPDRLDGFHTYNACCRSVHDTGRHASNLARYSVDRRAFENWAEGNWRGADRLMGMYKSSNKEIPCPSCGKMARMSADHIGPISLGFTHRMQFRPLCIECNSKKNNRMTLEDVKQLINVEASGEDVISWHSKFAWNKIKHKIKTDSDALRASKVLRRNMHYILAIFSMISEAGGKKFLSRFLHPEYARLDYEFTEFDIETGNFKAEEFAVDSLNTRKLASRYLRISFESLSDYNEKENRNHSSWNDKFVDQQLQVIMDAINEKDFSKADLKLNELLNHLGERIIEQF